jgi:hypothetical protein
MIHSSHNLNKKLSADRVEVNAECASGGWLSSLCKLEALMISMTFLFRRMIQLVCL